MKRELIGDLLDVCVRTSVLLFILVLSYSVQFLRAEIDRLEDLIHEESDRADEMESRLSWRVHELEHQCWERP